MKRVIYPVVLFILLVAGKKSIAQEGTAPRLNFEYQKYFLDQEKKQYAGHDTINVVFRFKNTGAQPLLLESVSSSCSCTVPNYTQQPIPAGETGMIRLTTTYDKLSIIRKVYAVIVANTKEKYYKVELFCSKEDDKKF